MKVKDIDETKTTTFFSIFVILHDKDINVLVSAKQTH